MVEQVIDSYTVEGYPAVLVLRDMFSEALSFQAEEHYSEKLLAGTFQIDRLYMASTASIREMTNSVLVCFL